MEDSGSGSSLNSTSETHNSRVSPSPSVESLLASLTRLRLGKGGLDSNWGGISMGNNSVDLPSNIWLADTQEIEVSNDSQHETGSDNFSRIPIGEVQGECLRPLNPQNIWAYNNFSNGGGLLGSNLYSGPRSSMGSLDYGTLYNLDHQENNFARNLTRDTMSTNSGSIAPSMSNLVAPQFERNTFLENPASLSLGRRDCMLHNKPNLYPTIASQNSTLDCPCEAIGRNDSYWGNYLYNSLGICGSLSNQETLNTVGHSKLLQDTDMVTLAMSKSGSLYLQNILSSYNLEITNKIIEGVLESIFKVMTDEYGQHVFQKLIAFCNEYQMQKIILKISQKSLIIDASLISFGSNSIQKLIRFLKRSPLISRVTSALAIGFYTLMTHQTGRHVILQCLNLLNSQQNELLYEAAIQHFIALSTHKVGCLSLKACIDYIKGPHRDRLLHVISEQAVFLSQDPSGNYVLQHVLKLENPVITAKISSRLQGNYIQLSLQQCGSNVVEKCLKCGGLEYVVKDLIASNKLLQVARDHFGNYVIQTALKITKNENIVFHQYLLRALEPHLPYLESHPTGKHVAKLWYQFTEKKVDLQRCQFQ